VKFISARPEASRGGHREVTAGLVSGPLEQSENCAPTPIRSIPPAINDHMIGVINACQRADTFDTR